MRFRAIRNICGSMAFLLITSAVLSHGQSANSTPVNNKPDQASTEVTIPADQQASDAQLNKLLDVTQARPQYQKIKQMMESSLKQQIAQELLTPTQTDDGKALTDEQQETYNKAARSYMNRVSDLVTSDEVLEQIIDVYKRHLSRSDVEATIAFYSSDAGKHMMTQQPIMMQEIMSTEMKLMQERIEPYIQQMKTDLKKIVATSQPATKKSATK
jgi:hypothetical protein